jgi:ribosomal-protein-alanine N-acetyltransferase
MFIDDAFPEFPRLATERLVLRPIEPDDADAILALYGDDAVAQYLDIDTIRTLDEARLLIRLSNNRFQDGLGIRWAIALRDQPRLIGTCGYNTFDHESRRSEIGYDLARAYWRRGIMSEALGAVLRYGFTTLDLHRVEATVAPENIASRRLLEHLGFREEGLLRQRSFYRGRYVDDMYFGLLRAEYQLQQASANGEAEGGDKS